MCIRDRVKGVSWWEEEVPSLEEYQEALANLERVNWTVDCVLTHCAPSGVVQEINCLLYTSKTGTRCYGILTPGLCFLFCPCVEQMCQL